MSALRVYVAGASAEVDMVAEFIGRLRDAGVIVTYDWTADVKAYRAAGKTDADMSDIERSASVSADYAAIARANVLWLLAPEALTIGAWAELGYANGIGTPAIVSGPASRQTIFTALCRVFATHEAAFRHLVERNARMLAEVA